MTDSAGIPHLPRNNVSLATALESPDFTIDEVPINFLVGYDASLGSKSALGMCMDYFMKSKPKLNIDVLHIYTLAAQHEGDVKYKKDTIESELSPYDVAFGDRYKLHLIRKDDETPTLKEGKMIVSWTYDAENAGRNVDFLVLGFQGRKTADIEDLVASDVSYALQYSRCSCIIAKQDFRIPEPGKFTVAVAVDCNPWSEKALLDALMLTQPGDKIHVVHISIREDETKKTDEYFEKMIARLGEKTGNSRIMEYKKIRHGGQGAAEDILNFTKEEGIDMVFMGSNAARLDDPSAATYLGSVSSKIICKIGVPMCVSHYDEKFPSIMGSDSLTAAIPPQRALPDSAAKKVA